jgi:hypothetical protein
VKWGTATADAAPAFRDTPAVITPNRILLFALAVTVLSGVGAWAVPLGDGGEVFVATGLVGLFGMPFGYLAAQAVADHRAEVEAVEQYGRKRGLPVADPLDPVPIPEEATLARQASNRGLFAGRAVGVTVNGRRGYLFLARYTVAGTTNEMTAPALLLPAALPASATFRIVPQGLLHAAGVPLGSSHRLEAEDPRAARKEHGRGLADWLGENPGVRVEVVGGTVVAWSEPTTGEVVRNAARSAAAQLPGRFDRLLELAARLVPKAGPTPNPT